MLNVLAMIFSIFFLLGVSLKDINFNDEHNNKLIEVGNGLTSAVHLVFDEFASQQKYNHSCTFNINIYKYTYTY